LTLEGTWVTKLAIISVDVRALTMAPFGNNRVRAIWALVVAGILWGTSDVTTKAALESIPPITLATLRFCVAGLILIPLARRSGLPALLNPRLAALGLFGVAGAFLFQNAGLSRTSAGNASMLQGAAPVLIIVGAAFFLGEALGKTRVVGSAIAVIGLGALTLTSRDGMSAPGLGDLCILGSALCFALFVILGRSLFRQYGTIPVLAGATIWALVALIPLASIELIIHGVGPVSPGTAGLVLYLGIGCSALTYVLWGYALTHLEASHAAVFDNMIPVVGVIAATIILRERPTHLEVFGGVLIVCGAWIASRPSITEMRHAFEST